MFKTRDAKAWQCEFPVGFLVKVCASNLLLINIFLDTVARIESRCVIKAKHVLLVCWFIRFLSGKTAPTLKCSCNFSHEKSNELTDQQEMFYYMVGTNISPKANNDFSSTGIQGIKLNRNCTTNQNTLSDWSFDDQKQHGNRYFRQQRPSNSSILDIHFKHKFEYHTKSNLRTFSVWVGELKSL